MVNLYEHIEALGKTHGFKNMTELCRAAGVPRATMSELKMGRSKDLSKPNAQKFADALHISLDEVYGQHDFNEKTPAVQKNDELPKNPDIRMIARAGKKMTPDQAEALRKYAQFMFPEAFEDDNT